MNPATTDAAFAMGYAEGNDPSGLFHRAWPSADDLEYPTPLTIAWSRGWMRGLADRDTGTPAWAFPDEPFRSDAAPGL